MSDDKVLCDYCGAKLYRPYLACCGDFFFCLSCIQEHRKMFHPKGVNG